MAVFVDAYSNSHAGIYKARNEIQDKYASL